MKTKIVLALVVVALLAALLPAAACAAGRCRYTAKGRHYLYNAYTVSGGRATLFGGYLKGSRTVDACGATKAYYYGRLRVYYPLVGTVPRLYVSALEVTLR